MDNKIIEIEQFLQDHSKKIGMGSLVAHNKVEYYLNLDDENLKRLTSRECAEASNILVRQALYIQGQMNKEKSLARWCHNHIDYLISPTVAEQGGVTNNYLPYKYRKNMAIAKNDTAKQLYKLLSKFKLKIENMNFITTRLEKVADKFDRLAYFKKEQ